jgi:hypothetical protein
MELTEVYRVLLRASAHKEGVIVVDCTERKKKRKKCEWKQPEQPRKMMSRAGTSERREW